MVNNVGIWFRDPCGALVDHVWKFGVANILAVQCASNIYIVSKVNFPSTTEMKTRFSKNKSPNWRNFILLRSTRSEFILVLLNNSNFMVIGMFSVLNSVSVELIQSAVWILTSVSCFYHRWLHVDSSIYVQFFAHQFKRRNFSIKNDISSFWPKRFMW